MKIKLVHGDCVKKMKNISDGVIDMTITSPPYDNLRTYRNSTQWGECMWKMVIQDLFRITKRGGVVVWIVSDATIKGSETGTSFRQVLWAKKIGFNLHDTMIWNKGCFSAVGSLSVRYAPVFEYMFILSKGKPKTFNPIKDRKNIYHGSKISSGTIRQKNGATKPFSKILTIKEFGQRFNIWKQSPQKQKGKNVHPAPFPEKLIYDHIITWSNEKDLILDPFMGSGTAGKVAKQLNRNFIGIEINFEYFRMAKNRLNSGK